MRAPAVVEPYQPPTPGRRIDGLTVAVAVALALLMLGAFTTVL